MRWKSVIPLGRGHLAPLFCAALMTCASRGIAAQPVGSAWHSVGQLQPAKDAWVVADTAVPSVTETPSRNGRTVIDASVASGGPSSMEAGVPADATDDPIADVASREVSALVDAADGQPVDVTSREISLLAISPPALPTDVVSREISVLAAGAAPDTRDLASREVSVHVDTAMPTVMDICSREVSVLFDMPTPTLLAMLTADASAAGIEVRWQFGDPAAFRASTLERADEAAGPFARVGATIHGVSGVNTAVDHDVVDGHTYWYRIVAQTTDEQALTFGPVSATAAVRVTEVSLTHISPNPANGRMQIDFALPEATQVRISVVDVLGREVAVITDRPYPAGRHSGTWDVTTNHGPAPAGVYFVRLRGAGKSLSRTVVITH